MMFYSTSTTASVARRRWRWTPVVAAGTVAMLSLTACSGGSGSGSSGSSGGTTTISFTSWDSEAVMKPVIAEFEKENPSIKVDFAFNTPSTYISTLQTRLLSGTASDVYILNPEDKNELVANKQVTDLSNESWVSNLSPANKDTYSVDGKLYGLSVASWGGGIMYNQDLLSKVGFSSPPTSWDDFLALCKKLKDAGITPFLEPGDGISVSLLALLGLQNDAADGKMDQNIFSGQSSFVKEWTPAISAWGQLFEQGLETRSTAGLTGDQTTSEFIAGKVAMIGTGSWNLDTVTKGAPSMKVGFFAVPGTTSGQTYWAGAASPAYAINAKSPHQEQDKKFLDFLASKAGTEAFNKSSGFITTTADYTPQVPDALKPMVSDVQKGKIYFAAVSWPKYANTLSPALTSSLQQYIQGTMTAEQFAASLDKKLAAAKSGA